MVQAKYRTYGQYRGYGDVQTLTGSGSDPVTESESTYYRGMSDDNNSTAVTLTDSQGGAHDDTNQLAGDTLESTQYNYNGGPVTGSTINSYWVSAPTASRSRTGLPALTANATGQVETWTRTALTDTRHHHLAQDRNRHHLRRDHHDADLRPAHDRLPARRPVAVGQQPAALHRDQLRPGEHGAEPGRAGRRGRDRRRPLRRNQPRRLQRADRRANQRADRRRPA